MTRCRHALRLGASLVLCLFVFPVVAQNLEIHVINVGWGQATFIKGPGLTGKTVLLEAGNTDKGTGEVVPYLQSIGHAPSAGFDYTIVGHQHCDHAGGMDEVISAGYNVRIQNYDNGSSYTSSCITGWDTAATGTTAGAPIEMTRGTVLDLGGGATLTCIVVRGQVIGGGNVAVSNENDLSIGLLLKYGGFDYFWASDLGGGADDFECTGRNTSQLNVETTVINAISPGGASPLISTGGIDVLHVSHHGSESSTNNDLFDGAQPAVAVISTGAGQDSSWNLPRTDVVDSVLLANASSCVTAPPTFVLQTEEGAPTGSLTSFSGYCVGDILITTDGLTTFTVDGNGSVTQGPNEKVAAGLPRGFTLDESGSGGGGDTQSPATSITAPVNGATVSGVTPVTASASDNVAVTRVEFWLDGGLASTDTTAPYEWSWDTTTAADGSHSLASKAYDAAGNVGSSSTITVTVSNAPPPPGANVSGWTITQANATYNFILPSGTIIPEDGYLVVARNATKTAFESYWGVNLSSNVIYIDSGDGMPIINGDENYTLKNALGVVVDGPTINMPASAARSLQRADPCGTTWNTVLESASNPGSGAAAGCGAGVKMNEVSDASGTGNFVYEFIELHNDFAGGDSTAPSTSITAPANGATVSGTTNVTASATDNVGVTKVEFWLDGALASTDTTSPYEWSWNTATASNGSHSLVSKAYDAASNIGTSSTVSVTVSNDTTAPTTSVTAPANGATVSGTTNVTASATDNVGVTKVEFWLDGALASTDTTSPYEWSWNTATASNGSHSLVSKAYDAAGNIGTSSTVSVTVSNGVSVTNYKITQSNSALTYFLPAGTNIPSKGYVIVARNATKAEFEAFWSRTLAANVIFVNSGDAMPQINGSESYTLYNAAGSKIDGATVAMASAGGESLQRTNGCGSANKAINWSRVASSAGTPGSGAPAPCNKGIYISEFSDALGTGNFVYEFIEFFNDK